jgi:GTP-binding protein
MADSKNITTNLIGGIDEDAIEVGRLLFAREAVFELGISQLVQIPEPGLPEIAFAGRSNVGKSSLINAVTGRNTLARTSNTPGRTQEINFFDLGGQLRLIDLPGYGFAKVPKEKVEAWTHMIKGYLRGRVTLRRACVLVDSRHGLKEVDKQIMNLLDDAGVAYQIILTKADKISSTALDKVRMDTAAALKKHPAAHPEVWPTSSEKGLGIPELRASLAQLAYF